MLGEYVLYKGSTFLVTKDLDNKVRIFRPEKLAPVVLQVLKTSVTRKHIRSPIIEYRGNKYLVTKTNLIISVNTGKQMKWGDTDGNRVAILKLKKER